MGTNVLDRWMTVDWSKYQVNSVYTFISAVNKKALSLVVQDIGILRKYFGSRRGSFTSFHLSWIQHTFIGRSYI